MRIAKFKASDYYDTRVPTFKNPTNPRLNARMQKYLTHVSVAIIKLDKN